MPEATHSQQPKPLLNEVQMCWFVREEGCCLKKIFLETKRIQMSIKRYFQNFVDFGVYKTEVLETTRIYVMLLKFAIYPDWGKVSKADVAQVGEGHMSTLLAPHHHILFQPRDILEK